jgi:2-octaprenyl-6-methoxyphenol hydroxylase
MCFGALRISAKNEQLSSLGYIINFDKLLQILLFHLPKNVNIYSCAELINVKQNYTNVTLNFKYQLNQITLISDFLISTDGAFSKIRELLQLNVEMYDFKQTAIVGNIKLNKPHNNIAYERFIKNDSIAMLPIKNNYSCFIWITSTIHAHNLMNMNNLNFIKLLRINFGNRLGEFINIDKRSSFPLIQTYMKNPVYHRILFMGNAAHLLHPITAQGFNLTLRDIAQLVDVISEYNNIIDERWFIDYYNKQKYDIYFTKTIVNTCMKLFSNNNNYLSIFGNISIMMLERNRNIKKFLNRHMMGLNFYQSKLQSRYIL